MESRVTKLEVNQQHHARELKELRSNFKELRKILTKMEASFEVITSIKRTLQMMGLSALLYVVANGLGLGDIIKIALK